MNCWSQRPAVRTPSAFKKECLGAAQQEEILEAHQKRSRNKARWNSEKKFKILDVIWALPPAPMHATKCLTAEGLVAQLYNPEAASTINPDYLSFHP